MTVDWRRFFLKAGIPKGVAERYSREFEKNRITADMLPDIDKSILTDLGVTTIGDQLAILKAAKAHHKELQLKEEESRIRVRIGGPDSSVSTSNSRKARTAPDAHEIYHVKLPDGTTERSQKILQKRQILVANGLPVRGTGVRQGGRDVSPVDKRSSAVIKMRRDRDLVEVTSSSDRAAISRLGVRGLHSDDGRSRIRVVGGRISKQGNFGGTNMLSRALTTHSEHDDRVMVGVPARQRITTSGRLQTSAKSSIPRVTVNPSSHRLKPMKQRITGNSMKFHVYSAMEDDDEMMEGALIEEELEEQAQVTYVDEYGNVIDDGEEETIVEMDDFRGFRNRNGGGKAQRRIQGGGNLGGRLGGRAKPAQQRITYTTEAAPSVFNRLSLA